MVVSPDREERSAGCGANNAIDGNRGQLLREKHAGEETHTAAYAEYVLRNGIERNDVVCV